MPISEATFLKNVLQCKAKGREAASERWSQLRKATLREELEEVHRWQLPIKAAAF